MKRAKTRENRSLLRRDELFTILQHLSARAARMVRESPGWRSMLKEAEASLNELLRSDPSLEEFRTEQMRFDGHSFSRLSLVSLINWLIERTTLAGPDKTLTDLEKYLNGNTFPCRFSIGVRGVTTAQAVHMADDIQLLPDSEDVISFGSLGKPPISTAAFTLVAELPKITASSSDSARLANTRAEAAGVEAFERLQIARMCVALVLNSRIVETTRTADTRADVPKSGGRSAASAAFPPNVPTRNLRADEATAAADLHSRLVSMPKKLRDRLAVALHRWHALFLRNGVNADFFIDLGIGLESVFVSSESSSEISYRIAIRGARLLGGSTVASRTQMSRMLTILYKARSTAAHSGRLLDKIPTTVAPTVGHLAMDGEELLRRAILTMIYRGRDDWEELEFA